MSGFKTVHCPECGDPLKGLQLTAEQRQWLDLVREAVIEHMKSVQNSSEEPSLDDQGWLAIAEPFLFLYGYMLSREEGKH